MRKFKLNWGWSILLVYLTFMIIFLFAFYRSFKELKTNELVTQDYYTKELAYGDVLKKKENADTMRVAVQLLPLEKGGLQIVFPSYMKDVSGKIILYKPDNAKLDRKIILKLDENNRQLIDKAILIPGRWNVSLDWQNNKTPYFVEEKMTLK